MSEYSQLSIRYKWKFENKSSRHMTNQAGQLFEEVWLVPGVTLQVVKCDAIKQKKSEVSQIQFYFFSNWL